MRKPDPRTDRLDKKILRELRRGLSINEVAEKLGVTPSRCLAAKNRKHLRMRTQIAGRRYYRINPGAYKRARNAQRSDPKRWKKIQNRHRKYVRTIFGSGKKRERGPIDITRAFRGSEVLGLRELVERLGRPKMSRFYNCLNEALQSGRVQRVSLGKYRLASSEQSPIRH